MHQRGAEAKRKQNQVKKWVFSIAISASCMCDVQFVRPRCICHLSPNCLAEVLVWDAVTAVCPCELLIPIIHAGKCSAVSPISIPVSVSAPYMMKQMDVVAAHGVEQVPNWLQTSRARRVRGIKPGLYKAWSSRSLVFPKFAPPPNPVWAGPRLRE